VTFTGDIEPPVSNVKVVIDIFSYSALSLHVCGGVAAIDSARTMSLVYNRWLTLVEDLSKAEEEFRQQFTVAVDYSIKIRY
jgi:hypothetical protein